MDIVEDSWIIYIIDGWWLRISMDNLTFIVSLYSLKLSRDNVTVYMETVYNSSNSMNSTRNLNKNSKKVNWCALCQS